MFVNLGLRDIQNYKVLKLSDEKQKRLQCLRYIQNYKVLKLFQLILLFKMYTKLQGSQAHRTNAAIQLVFQMYTKLQGSQSQL